MKRDPDYKIVLMDWLTILGIVAGVGVLVYIAMVLIEEGTWVVPLWIQAFLK